jgi:microcystin-dependent protein
MANPYVGEIRMFGGNFAPVGWAFCQGQLLAISENETLFNLIGTTYGGDGQSTFALPDLRGRIPLHMGTSSGGSSHVIGELAGVESVTLTAQQIPVHSHTLEGSSDPASPLLGPQNSLPGDTSASGPMYDALSSNGANIVTMSGSAIGVAGGSQPHNNLAPYLCVSFIISLFGIFPSQS